MIVDSALYRAGVRVAVDCTKEDLGRIRDEASGAEDFVWVGMHQPDEDELNRVAEVFSLHPLAVEDALKAHQRPKLERYEEGLFLVLKTLWYVDEQDAVLGHGPCAVVYAICDTVVDSYEAVATALEVDVDEVEESVFSPTRTQDSRRIYILKRELAEVRRAVNPLREPMKRFATGSVAFISQEASPFFRDVADHVIPVSESIETLDSLLSTAFDAHLARISVQQNEDMRKISAWVAIAAVGTLVAGVYGMNFDRIPELHWHYGYFYALGLMLVASVVLYRLFKKSGWL